MHYVTTYVLTLLIILSSGFSLQAQRQDGKLVLYGSTLELNLSDSTETRTGYIPIEILKDDSAFVQIESSRSARYEAILPFGHIYEVKYGGDEFQTKSVVLDVSNVTGTALKRGFRLEIDMSLFKNQSEELASILLEPVAKAEFSSKEKMILFDAEYTEEMYQKLKQAMKGSE